MFNIYKQWCIYKLFLLLASNFSNLKKKLKKKQRIKRVKDKTVN